MMHGDGYDDALPILLRITPDFVKEILADESFENLLKSKNKYDMLITFTSLSEFIFPFADVFKIPLIQVHLQKHYICNFIQFLNVYLRLLQLLHFLGNMRQSEIQIIYLLIIVCLLIKILTHFMAVLANM